MRLYKLGRVFLFFLMMFVLAVGLYAEMKIDLTPEEKTWLKSNPEIHLIGESNQYPVIFKTLEGKVSGVLPEYLEIISDTIGADIIVDVPSENLTDIHSLALSDKFHGLAIAFDTAKNQQNYSMTKPYTSTPFNIFTVGEQRWKISGAVDLQGKKVVVLEKHYAMQEYVKAIPDVSMILARTPQEQFSMVQNGDADALVGYITYHYLINKLMLNDIKLAYVSKQVQMLGVAVNRHYPELQTILNKAIETLPEEVFLSIQKKWNHKMVAGLDNTISFTSAELEFIRNTPPIKIGVMDSYAPFSFQQKDKWNGYTHELLKIISERSGLTFKVIPGSWPEIFGQFKADGLDMISEISYQKEREGFTHFSKPYFEVPMAIYSREGFSDYRGLYSLEGKKVGIVKNAFITPELKKIKNVEIIEYTSVRERFQALSSGKLDFVVSSISVAYRLEQLGVPNIRFAGQLEFEGVQKEDLRFGVRKENSPLASIIDKSLNSVSFAEWISIKNRWIVNVGKIENSRENLFDETEKAFIREHPHITFATDATWAPLVVVEKDGSIKGIDADTLKLLNETLGLNIELKVGVWAELVEQLKKKEIDGLSSSAVQEKRRTFASFTHPYCSAVKLMYVKKSRKEQVEAKENFSGVRIGIQDGNLHDEMLMQNFPEAIIIRQPNCTALFDALLSDEVDLILASDLTNHTLLRSGYQSIIPLQTVGKPLDLVMSIRNDWPELVSILNKGLALIEEKHRNEIKSQYTGNIIETLEEQGKNILNSAEKRFLKEHPIIRFRTRPNRPPFEFSENGQARGIAVDYIKLIAEKAGFTPQFVINDLNIKDTFQVMEGGREAFDTVLFNVSNSDRVRRFAFGDTYLSYPMMIIVNKESPYVGSLKDLQGKRVVLEKGFLTNKWLKRDYPDIRIIPAKNTLEALQMVNDNKVDAYVGNMAVANYMLIHGGMEDLKIAAPSDYGMVEYKFIAPKEWPELVSILSKGYKTISPQVHSSIQQKWFSLQFVEKTDYALMFKILGALVVLIFGILWWNRQLKIKVNRGIEKYKQQEAMLRQQSRMAVMGEMIGNIAHQWKQPLNAISITTEDIVDLYDHGELTQKDMKESTTRILNLVQHMNTTIGDFRNFFKPTKEKHAFNPVEAIQETCKLIEANIQQAGITTYFEGSDQLQAYGYANEFKQVLINIINNARDILVEKGTKNGEIYFRAGMNEAGEKIRISISDNGGGIPKELLPGKLFEAYVTTKGERGTGIGLHMSKSIIEENMNGTLIAHNVEGGAEFIIMLPRFQE